MEFHWFSMEFHGIMKLRLMEFHGIQLTEFDGIRFWQGSTYLLWTHLKPRGHILYMYVSSSFEKIIMNPTSKDP
jgi:hypothetical protein